MRALAIALLAISTAWGQTQLSEVVVDVDVQGQKLIDVLQKLQKDHDLNYAVSHATLEEAGLVSVSLKQVPLDVALESMLSACNLNLEIRGTVLVILPRGVEPGPQRLPSVTHGVPDRGPPTASYPDAPPAAAEDPPLSEAIGTTQEIDLEDRRLRIRVDGVARDFFIPQGNALLGERLKGSIMRLKPGEPIHVLYEPDGKRPLIRALIGGAYAGEETRRQAQRRNTRDARPARTDENVIGSPDTETRTATPRSAARNRTTAPEGDAEDVEVPLVGQFVGLGGGVVKIKRADGEILSCDLPADREAREKCEAAFKKRKAGDQVVVVYVETNGRRVIRHYLVGDTK